ncbi:Beta-carbonic anhydrase 1 [Madurella mycetomatis]|uniref:Beta-carbonic anhydrase 1 n=1 Tax=Madurella mycetomatis TaxID=100816 RepID=A0A175VQJ8_9PEZI|nr:Beta-carbonic anhydrase 1 [Madurella mycetomatis]
MLRSISESHIPVRTFADILSTGRTATKILVALIVETIVHRNAGGNIRHALRDILMLDRAFELNEIAIIHHTDCGTLTSTDLQIRTHIKARVNKAHRG